MKPSLSNEQVVRRASIISLSVSLILLIAKFWGYRQTGSQAIFSDAMESIVNVVAAALAIVVIAIARKPADKEHPYGHGKIEYFSAAFEGGLISFAALLICIEAVQSLVRGESIYRIGIGVVITVATAVVNAALGFYLGRVGRKNHSAALEASGEHVLSDVLTSAGIVVGLGLVALTGEFWLDSVVALTVGLLLARTGYKLVRKSIGGLLDEGDRGIIEHLARIVDRDRMVGIIQVHHVRIMRAGGYHHIDAHAVVPEFWTVAEAHEKTEEFERRLMKNYSYSGELHLHVDPCRRAYCLACEVEGCLIRRQPFEKRRVFSIDELTSPEEPVQFTHYKSPI